MTDFSLADQAVCFLASLAFGAAAAALYDLVRAARMLIRCSRAHILVSDILFFFFCGILTSLFTLPFSRGDIRAFILFGEAAGFLTYRLTLGRIFGKFYAVIARLLRLFLRKNCEKLKKIFDFLLKAGAFLVYNILEAIEGFRRTVHQGAGALVAEARERAVKKRGPDGKKRVKRSRKRRGAARTGAAGPRENQKYYAIPLKGDRNTDIRKNYEQKRSKTRKNRDKNR